MLQPVLVDYAIAFGWAIVGSVSMGLGVILALKMFDWSTRDIDEWELIKQGNIPVAMILSSIVVSLGIVISAALNPKATGGHAQYPVSGPADIGVPIESDPDGTPFGE